MHLKDELPTMELESLDIDISSMMSAVDTIQTADMMPQLSIKDTPAAATKCTECPNKWTAMSDVQCMSISLALLAVACALLAFIAKKRRSTLFCKEHHYQPLI